MKGKPEHTAPLLEPVSDAPSSTMPSLPPTQDTRVALEPVVPAASTTLGVDDDDDDEVSVRHVDPRLVRRDGLETGPSEQALPPVAAATIRRSNQGRNPRDEGLRWVLVALGVAALVLIIALLVPWR